MLGTCRIGIGDIYIQSMRFFHIFLRGTSAKVFFFMLFFGGGWGGKGNKETEKASYSTLASFLLRHLHIFSFPIFIPSLSQTPFFFLLFSRVLTLPSPFYSKNQIHKTKGRFVLILCVYPVTHSPIMGKNLRD